MALHVVVLRWRRYRQNVRSTTREWRQVAQAFWFELDPNRAQRVSLAKSVGA
jgi:hypothetical protein